MLTHTTTHLEEIWHNFLRILTYSFLERNFRVRFIFLIIAWLMFIMISVCWHVILKSCYTYTVQLCWKLLQKTFPFFLLLISFFLKQSTPSSTINHYVKHFEKNKYYLLLYTLISNDQQILSFCIKVYRFLFIWCRIPMRAVSVDEFLSINENKSRHGICCVMTETETLLTN